MWLTTYWSTFHSLSISIRHHMHHSSPARDSINFTATTITPRSVSLSFKIHKNHLCRHTSSLGRLCEHLWLYVPNCGRSFLSPSSSVIYPPEWREGVDGRICCWGWPFKLINVQIFSFGCCWVDEKRNEFSCSSNFASQNNIKRLVSQTHFWCLSLKITNWDGKEVSNIFPFQPLLYYLPMVIKEQRALAKNNN